MVLRKVAIVGLSLICAIQPAWGSDPPSTAAELLYTYSGNHGFIHEVGYHVPYGWAAMYRVHPAGYFIRGQQNGGEVLPEGTYRYVFYFSLLPGSLGGWLKNANDVVRVEAWDTTSKQCLISRTFQRADFPITRHRSVLKTLTFSTWPHPGHRLEPRIYWQGLSGIFLRRVDLVRLQDVSADALKKKAEQFEALMSTTNLDRGFVVSRDRHGNAEDVGDAAIWTGLYAATEAWRYRATHAKEARSRMEFSLRALHQLHAQSPRWGTLVRYIAPDGRSLPDAASKDSYTGFFFAVANCLPYVHDRQLRKDLLADVQALGDHFLDHDLSFIPARGATLRLDPSVSTDLVKEGLDELRNNPGARRELLQTLEAVHLYFFSHAQRPWRGLPEMIRALKHNDISAVSRLLPRFLAGASSALRQLQRNVAHSAGPNPRWADGPYGKLNRLLLRMIRQLPSRISRPEDLRVMSSQALHALHILKVIGETLPKPNRFEQYYAQNLRENKALLETVLQWDNIDEDLVSAVAGESRAGTFRTASAHLTFLALYDLIELEKDRSVRQDYLNLFQRQYEPMQNDYNAMLHVMAQHLALPSAQPGIGLWSLMLYPADRRGRGERYWQARHRALVERYGALGGQAREPLPVNERQRDTFIWQRSARSLRGDHEGWRYPPLDYLFVYWLARADGAI